MYVIALSVAIYYVVRWIRRMSVPPDPWESEVTPAELREAASPVCVTCLAPVADPTQHYCPVCGNVTGEFTRYIPFLNIPFNYSLFATLWAKIRNPAVPPASRLVALVVILLFVPPMLVVGLPILLYCKLRGRMRARVGGGHECDTHSEVE